MGYAEVCVNSRIAHRQTFSYAIPPELSVGIGQAVLVPFGERLLQGVVLQLSDYPAVDETRDIAGIIEPRPVLSPTQISLACWISQYYLSPLFDAVALMLPPGFERPALTFISITPTTENIDPSSLTPDQSQALELLRQQGKMSLRQLEKELGRRKAPAVVSQLVRRSLVTRSYELGPVRVKPKTEPYLSLIVDTREAEQQVSQLSKTRADKQAALLDFLTRQSSPISLAAAKRQTNCTRATAGALCHKNLIKIEDIRTRRSPFALEDISPSEPPVPTAAQESTFRSISASLSGGNTGGDSSPAIFLVHGVTGSGKTEVYLQALAETVRQGKRGIVLVPEIALTHQTIERFAARFANRVAILHSRLSAGEQLDEWHRISNGEADVVIGPRSAIFAPQPDLGLIIIDEEHEWTYKQNDQSPRYDARRVARKLAELSGAVVVLGSATPAVETYYHSQRGDYHRLELPERVTPNYNSPLPRVEVVDLREELKAGNRSLFSRSLSQNIERVLSAGEQVILFLNRRGTATFIQCRDCGFVLQCRRCEVTLTYHLDQGVLACHQCNYRIPVPRICPRCSSQRIKFLGAGTQKLEQETHQAFPGARLLRWDSDTTRGKYSHQQIFNSFRDRQADILIGTQIITKGLDLPGVTLVGVVNADTGLNLPDFRAGERTYQLLSQVAGRSGRGSPGGLAIIQTYCPEHYAIQAAARHDYDLLYGKEITYRRSLNNPPFKKLASLIYAHTNDTASQREATRMKRLIVDQRDSQGTADLNIIGPAPAFRHRIRGRFRWQLIVRGSDPTDLLTAISFPQGWTIDIDPVGL